MSTTKTLANCTLKEFLQQANRIRKEVETLFKAAKIKDIRKHLPVFKGDETPEEKAEMVKEQGEKNLSDIYKTRASFYSTEGSSLCIRAMIFMAMQYSGGKKKILAGRNAHKTLLSALALCDIQADWLYGDDLYSCNITASELEKSLECMLRVPIISEI